MRWRSNKKKSGVQAAVSGRHLSIWPGLACSPHSSAVTLIGAAAARSAYLPNGVAVIYRSCPEVANQGEDDAPGDGEDRAVADRSSQQQPAQRVDDRREGLVLGEPAYSD